MDQFTKGSEIPWMDDSSQSITSIPEIVIEESNQIGIVVIIVISALLTIALLFGVAVFIDCRQQKLTQLQERRPPKKLFKMKLPRIGRPVREDESSFADKMQEPDEQSTSNNVIV